VGAPLGGELAVNTYTTALQERPETACNDDGRFVIVWDSESQDGDLSGRLRAGISTRRARRPAL
jgi:hypothetical protein